MNNPLLITYEYPPEHGGVGKYLEAEVQHFEEKEKNEVVIIHAQEYEMPLWPQWLPLLWKTLGQLRKNKRNSIWLSHILPIGYIAVVYKKILKIPYRVYLHGLDLVGPRKSFWKSFWVRRILLNADEIIVNSNATAKLLEYYNIPSSLAHVHYPKIQEVDVKKYKITGDELRKKYKLEGKPVLLTVSRLVKRKGIDLVIQALPEVYKKIPNLFYVVVGEGDYSDHLKKLADNQKNIIFTGAVSEEEKYSWLSTSDCFILTPLDDPDDFEGYGIVYKEAQMFGKPIIGSKTGGVPEAVGENGTLVEPSNMEQITQEIIKKIK